MWTQRLIGQVLDSPLRGDDTDGKVTGFHFDSRLIQPGNCFIALLGSDRDGHDFIPHAKAMGASCVIGQRDADFIVPDSFVALQALAAYARDHSKAKRIAVTGSVGKTSAVAFLGQILGQRHKVIVPQGSFNNHIGVPLTMLGLLNNHVEFGIFEIGTNHPGEVRPLADLVQPHIAIVTKVGLAHIGNFHDQYDIAVEKAQILYALVDDGVGIVPDDAFWDVYRASGKELVKIGEEAAVVHIPPRLHTNISMVIKAARLLGVTDYDLSLLQVPGGRGHLKKVLLDKHTAFVIDDAYNAAFDAVMASLDDFTKMPGRKILVIGDMGEVGDMSDTYHAQVAAKIKSSNIDHVIPVSRHMSHALSLPITHGEDVVPLLRSLVHEGDTILLKGSHASGVWKIAALLNS